MIKWKYYSLTDRNEETVGTCYAENKEEAYVISSRMKKLPTAKFRELFGVKKL
jgi:hypothetical protein